MSTKIYNAWEWQGSLSELMTFLVRIRNEAIDLAKDEVLRKIVNSWIRQVDEATIYGKIQAPKWSEYCWEEYYRLEKLELSPKRMDFSIRGDVVIFLLENRIFFQTFICNQKIGELFRKKLEKETKASDYSYWNNVDWPDDVSYEEWKEREATWERILVRGIPAQDGLNFELVNFNMLYNMEFTKNEKNSVLPSIEERAKPYAFDRLVEAHLSEAESRRYSAIMRLEHDSKGKYLAEYSRYINEVSAILSKANLPN